ncbi:MAG: selenide, water dikinase SelD [Phormidesmis sp. CAN_BIN36]|nr:selenide, water dikinase SelD [Phormidesmis sp. CAN_BIN36]
MKRSPQPIVKDLVLIGGGHSHAIVLRMFGMHPLPGVRLTLITEASDTPYSGMLPGHIAGFYDHEDCHINLRSLCQFAQAQIFIDTAIGLDLENNRVLCADRPPVAFDWVSIDIGSTPKMPIVAGATQHSIAAKPVQHLLAWWNQLTDSLKLNPEKPLTLSIVGGVTGGVELALNMQHRLHDILQKAEQPIDHLTLHLFHNGANLMPKHNAWVQHHFYSLLTQRGIHLHLSETICEIKQGTIVSESGLKIPCDATVWVTQASAPDWLSKAGLAVDDQGFMLVNDALQSVSHPQVFAAGDIATMVNYSRPKAGVFAVRQGKPLFKNLQNIIFNQPLRPYHPQKNYLSLIGTGDESAVASYGLVGWNSALLWRMKDRIDRTFMRRFHNLPSMDDSTENTKDPTQPLMRCLGCGAKVGSNTLERSLQRIHQDQPIAQSQDILIGLDAPDDATVVQVPIGKVLVQTIDYFPALLSDPFLFGQISTHHSLSDVFAMGATAQSALAIATIPYATEAKQEETLYQLLSGAVKALQQAGAVLIGGHTVEGADLAFGLSCNGFADPTRLLRKSGMQPGQVLILTKEIGTGTLFAAEMRRQAKASWIDGAIASMLISNQQAATCFLTHGATACTDITGFGLLGHLVEMVRASGLSVNLDLSALPILEGARQMIRQEIFSSLYPQNLRSSQAIANIDEANNHRDYPLLFDPQTSGGLLASVDADRADACLTALRSAGYVEATIVGHVLSKSASDLPFVLCQSVS